MVDPGDVHDASVRIADHVRTTPVVAYQRPGTDLPLSLKLEMLQHTGSFKVRGAFNKLLTSPVPAKGVIAASGGNHGLAVAYAARRLGVPAEIYVPTVISPAKLNRLRSIGADVTVAGSVYSEALSASAERAAATGAMVIHAYDDAAVVAGQGTTFREFDAQVPDLDTVIVAVGGGGLIGGAAAWFGNGVRLLGVETHGTATLHTALAAGAPTAVEVSGVAADALGARTVGEITFTLARAYVHQVLLVSDEDVEAAMRTLWDDLRLVTEPGGATALAALLAGRYVPAPEERVGVLICGANTDPAAFGLMVNAP